MSSIQVTLIARVSNIFGKRLSFMNQVIIHKLRFGLLFQFNWIIQKNF